MGCRTGFYLLLYGIAKEEALSLTKRCVEGCLALSAVPGIEKKQCGNYLEHDYEGSLKELSSYKNVLSQI
jgi:S-ribosylhomocysteine lyase